ncbi:hypothetical protein SAMN00768000_0214 [Sulfobacillus thermosulfidooxidans DSM 9293]|uniref:Uncharacterized protein n=1 Tax=Sulfobacillus thermosulfidooxidans (strain DSM 9293 / VKM B-1269 / AT-1) TaxID=929705 RepID=A0A1W1W6U0_SULTA|nr:hypothetical protein [Sulfobacillus thermosulfidooxidans]SMC02007.1 hypothetical protein SAMN00768000_0214 [Sulfobacillus thermosulfidooxidans DSM 9293]
MSSDNVLLRVFGTLLPQWRFWLGAAWAAVLISLTNHWFLFWALGMPFSLYTWFHTAQVLLSLDVGSPPRFRHIWTYLFPPIPFWAITTGTIFLLGIPEVLIIMSPTVWPHSPWRSFLWGPQHVQHAVSILVALGLSQKGGPFFGRWDRETACEGQQASLIILGGRSALGGYARY